MVIAVASSPDGLRRGKRSRQRRNVGRVYPEENEEKELRARGLQTLLLLCSNVVKVCCLAYPRRSWRRAPGLVPGRAGWTVRKVPSQ